MRIIDYRPEYQPYFEQLNRAWLEKYFVMEPLDEWVLTHPKEALIDTGGCVLFAEHEGSIVGTVALRRIASDVYELTKMTVAEGFRGQGAGRFICMAGIEKARALNARKLILFTSSILQNAIHIYRTLGFIDVPVQPGQYKRADVMMEIVFKTGNFTENE